MRSTTDLLILIRKHQIKSHQSNNMYVTASLFLIMDQLLLHVSYFVALLYDSVAVF
jgi:pyoverdine/dityrosine biosynthesis protein Dit1